jgi:hypothetical protein
MKLLLQNIYTSFPVQLVLLHFRKYQVLLIFWLLLSSVINSGFLKSFGADALFFMPEYLGEVGMLSAALVGMAMGIFFMSWNITTFILHTQRFKFLAATSKPFLKYCINNAVLPLVFLLFYLVKAILFNANKELLSAGEQMLLIAGFVLGLTAMLLISFVFFFGADRQILMSIAPVVADKKAFRDTFHKGKKKQSDAFGLKVSYYFTVRLRLRKARNVSHYSEAFLDAIFKRHHFAAILCIILAFIFLIIGGFFLDHRLFQFPAAVSITLFSAIMVAVIGALSYFLQSWSVVFVLLLLGVLNWLYQKEIIDPRNKAYGLNYSNKKERPLYNKAHLASLCTPEAVAADSLHWIAVLNHWKNRQVSGNSSKPKMVFVNVSGGGLRSATFVMNMLQHTDAALGGTLMNNTFMITGASGGMLSATYYRELYRRKQMGQLLDLASQQYITDITQDLLNPVFSSLISRDIFSPAQQFSVGPYQYIKDRGYAFEQKLNDNTGKLLNGSLKDYAADEQAAKIPLMLFSPVVTRDGRKLLIGTQPMRCLMKPSLHTYDTSYSPDAIDFGALFARQNPYNLRLLTALRMNATFPYVLPNVWLPTYPIIDVMDAGLRDNFGIETTLRFVDKFRQWLQTNTSGIVILQMRDRIKDNWQHPLETGAITDIVVKPATMLQNNWYKLQDYALNDQYSYLNHTAGLPLQLLTYMYQPQKEEKQAALNFHLTAAEKRDIIASANTPYNQDVLKSFIKALQPTKADSSTH